MVRIAAIDVVLNSRCVTEKKPDRQQQVVHGGDDGADRELPFEAEPQIEQHGEDRHDDAERAGLHQFARHARADDLDATHVIVRFYGPADLGDGCLLRRVAARLQGEA